MQAGIFFSSSPKVYSTSMDNIYIVLGMLSNTEMISQVRRRMCTGSL